jgi:hypothetical protein
MMARISKTNGSNGMQYRGTSRGRMSHGTRCQVAVAVLTMISSPVWAQAPSPGLGSPHGLHPSAASMSGATGKLTGPSAGVGPDDGPQSTLYGLSNAEKRELRRQILDAGRELYVRPTSDPVLLMPAAELP